MRILKTILQTIVMAVYFLFGKVTEYVGKHWLPFAVFGGLLAVILAVYIDAGDDDELKRHILNREFSVHLGWGALLFMLFTRLLLVFERTADKAIPWFVWYFAPLVVTLAINATNEWGIAMTPPPERCADCPWLGGDWARAVEMGDQPLRWKSVADLAGWQFGGLVAAWWSYYMADQLAWARRHYLDSREWARSKRLA